MKISGNLLYAFLAMGISLFLNPYKTLAEPSLFYAANIFKKVDTRTCVNEGYAVLSEYNLNPARSLERIGNASFAMSKDRETSVIIYCTHANNTGHIMVIAASDGFITIKYPRKILDSLADRLFY